MLLAALHAVALQAAMGSGASAVTVAPNTWKQSGIAASPAYPPICNTDQPAAGTWCTSQSTIKIFSARPPDAARRRRSARLMSAYGHHPPPSLCEAWCMPEAG